MVDGFGEDARVSPAGPMGRHLALQDDDLQARGQLLEEQCRPEPGQAGADDGDLRLVPPLEWHDVVARLQGQPVAGPLDVGDDGLPNKSRQRWFILPG